MEIEVLVFGAILAVVILFRRQFGLDEKINPHFHAD